MNLPRGFDPNDVLEHLQLLAPGVQAEFSTQADESYIIKSTASAEHVAEAIRLAVAGDLSHIIRRLVPKIKARATAIILGRKQLPAQINQLARGEDLLLQFAEFVEFGIGEKLTADEWAELRAGRALYREFVQPVRARSNELEVELQRMTRAELLAAELANWPDEVWPL